MNCVYCPGALRPPLIVETYTQTNTHTTAKTTDKHPHHRNNHRQTPTPPQQPQTKPFMYPLFCVYTVTFCVYLGLVRKRCDSNNTHTQRPLIHVSGHGGVDDVAVRVEHKGKESVKGEEGQRRHVEELVLGEDGRHLGIQHHEQRRRWQHSVHLCVCVCVCVVCMCVVCVRRQRGGACTGVTYVYTHTCGCVRTDDTSICVCAYAH